MLRRDPLAIVLALVLGIPAQVARCTDLPPAGRSLFDHLTTRSIDGQSVQHIPYPFTALLAELARHAGTDGLGRPGLAAVLIPLGRSLQRNASAGDYFRHPRVVVAITGEQRSGAAPRLHLKDRLFLGFQDEAGVIEVISYNEAAGRFEFQVITGYRAGAKPRVAYARRAVCSACHHASAPIFSRPGWDETNANPVVARALFAHAPAFHGVDVKRGVDVPNAIDESVARANRAALAQGVWQQACDAVTPPSDPVGCRAALLRAALARRLTGSRDTELADAEALRALRTAWQRVWPQGLAEPDPNIPNRDPFFGRAQELDDGKAAAPWGAEEVVPALDPMSARKPLAVWQPDANGFDAVSYVLGSFFSEGDVRALERALERSSARAKAERSGRQGSARAARPSTARQDRPAATTERDADRMHALRHAIARVADDTRTGRSDALGSAAFRRAAVLRALGAQLGALLAPDCCDEPRPAMSGAMLEGADSRPPPEIPEALKPFYAHCSACHGMPTASPPGFLHGSVEDVERSIARCAARIRFRLSMWQLAPGARAKTPMPPPIFVPAWTQAAPRAGIEQMMRYAERVAAADASGIVPRSSYESLPPCREDAAGAHAVQAR